MATPKHATLWTMMDTKLWIHEISLKLNAWQEAIEDARLWCEDNKIESEPYKIATGMLAILWVGYQLNEPVSKWQALELLQQPNWDKLTDQLMHLPPEYGELQLHDLLAKAVNIRLN